MSATISFKDDKFSNKTTEIKPVGTLPGALKYVLKKDLPKAEDKSVMVYTTDTMELFIGGGFGQPLKRVSDIVLVSDVDALPDSGIKEKLYVSAADKAIYFWDDTDGFLQVGGGSGGTAVQTKIMEYPAAGDFPAAGQSKAIYIAKDTDFLYRYDLGTAKYMQLARQTTDPTIAAKFGAIDKALAEKAAKTDLAGYRAVGEPIAEADLDAATAAKLNAIVSPPYDDSALRARVAAVEGSKADKTALVNYRRTDTEIAEADLDAALKAKLNAAGSGYDDTALKADIAKLQADSATKADVTAATADVLKRTDKIEEENLSTALAAKINAVGAGYDDTAIKNRLNAVETDKAGLTYTEATYLKKTDRLSQNQLPTELTDKIDSMEADLDTKASKSEVDAAADSLAKLTTAVNALTADVNQKADKSEITALQGKLTTAETDLSTAKTDIGTLESTVADLLDRLSALEAANPPKAAIKSVGAVEDKNAVYGMAWKDLGLPATVTITLADGRQVAAAVVWESSDYDASVAGTQVITGIITPPDGTVNTEGLKATVKVVVAAPANSFTHIFSFENPTDTATGILLDDIATGLRFTTDEFYITNDVKLYYLGLEPSREFAANPQYVPTSIQAGEGMAVTSPDGYADFDEDPDVGGKIYFSGGSLGTRVYQVVRE